ASFRLPAGLSVVVTLCDVQQPSGTFGDLTHVLTQINDMLAKLTKTLPKLAHILGEQLNRLR
ncbi:MAG: hypothetical protein WCC92_03560, partial [Candidatus Korobacteraceae bacterium]